MTAVAPSRHRHPALRLLAVAVTSTALSCPAWAQEEKSLPQQIVETLNKLSGGPHAGFRANHAKGIVVTGSFAAAPTGKSVTKASHVQPGVKVPVIVRFSNPTGVPNLPDASPYASPHGIAIRFNLPDGSFTDIVSISFNGFPVSTPEDFLGLLQAVATSGPDTPSPKPIEQFLGSHPKALKFVTTPKPAPVSYATLPFFGVNAFKFTDAAGKARHGRYQILPVLGDQRLSDEEAAKQGPDYLIQDVEARLAKGPIQYRILVQIAEDGDVIIDPTEVWPAERKTVELGVLTLNAVAPDNAETQRKLAFNPLILNDGIEPTADPVLLARPGAYAVSVGQRAQ